MTSQSPTLDRLAEAAVAYDRALTKFNDGPVSVANPIFLRLTAASLDLRAAARAYADHKGQSE